MSVATEVPHPPTRPAWWCERCDQAWPCHPARMQLAEQYAGDPVGLSVYLGARLVDAARELPATPAAELHERFIAWTR